MLSFRKVILGVISRMDWVEVGGCRQRNQLVNYPRIKI